MFFLNSPFDLLEVINLIVLSFSFLFDPINLIFYISLFCSYNLIKNNLYKGIVVPLLGYKGLLISIIVVSFIVKYVYGMDLVWWERMLQGLGFSLVISIIKNKLHGWYRDQKVLVKEVGKSVKKIENNKNIYNEIDNKKDKNKDKKNIKVDKSNEVNNSNKIEKIKVFIINLIKKIFNIGFIFLIYSWLFNQSIYCEPTGGGENNSSNSNTNTNTNFDTNSDKNNDTDNNKVKGKEKEKNEDKSFNISGHMSKGMIKEAVEGMVAPTLEKSKGIEISVSGPNLSSSTKISSPEVIEESVKNFNIPSILEKELSPLEMILNSEIILSVLILLHICLIILIGLHKLYISSGLNIISKLFSKKLAAKYENFKKMIENIGTTYLIILVIINVILILFYVFVLIYANVELSNNIDAYINVHLNMKKSVIMLLFVKSQSQSKIIVNKIIRRKLSIFNVWSILQNKKIKANMMVDVDWDNLSDTCSIKCNRCWRCWFFK